MQKVSIRFSKGCVASSDTVLDEPSVSTHISATFHHMHEHRYQMGVELFPRSCTQLIKCFVPLPPGR